MPNIVTGTDSGETLNGTSGDDRIEARGGDDVINASTGVDTVDGGAGMDRLAINPGQLFVDPDSWTIVGNRVFDSTGSIDTTFSSIESLLISDGNWMQSVSLDASAADEGIGLQFFTVASQGHLVGSSGDDILGFVYQVDSAVVDGGAGNDFLTVNVRENGYTLSVEDGEILLSYQEQVIVTATNIEAFDLALYDIPNAVFDASAFDPGIVLSFALSTAQSTIIGSAGANYFSSVSNDAQSRLTGFGGADTYIFYSVAGIGGAAITDFGEDDRIDLSPAANARFIGSAAFSGIAGEYRVNTFDGTTELLGDTDGDGVADETLLIESGAFALAETAAGSNVLRIIGIAGGPDPAGAVIAGGSGDDRLEGGIGNDTIRGGGGNDTIHGKGGADRIDGGAGADLMAGGAGNDRYVVDDAGDQVIEQEGEGTDSVRSSVSFSLAGQYVEALTLTGTAAIDGTGNGLDNIITGNAQANVIDGGGGADEMIGRKGDDTYVVDNVGDRIVELAGEGSDIVNASVSYSLAGQYAEVLNLMGSALNGSGNGLNNRIVGNELANTINGGAGNDRLDGGAGADTMVGGTGNDVFVVDNVGDKVGEKVGEGTDTVEASISYSLAGQYVEVLRLTGWADLSATGNNQANSLFGNGGANLLDGKGGADTMAGGAGDDRYVIDDAGDKVVELANEGMDSVEASVTFSLAGQYAESLTLTGSNAINGTGNGLANILTGNGVANTLSGGGGDDVLNGGLGSDKLYGGTGADVFVFDTGLGANNVDQVLDFVAADDTVRLDRSVFGALAEGALSASVFVAGTAAVDADDRIVFDKASGNLWYDADGNGAGAAVLFANFGAGEAMSAADFVVIP